MVTAPYGFRHGEHAVQCRARARREDVRATARASGSQGDLRACSTAPRGHDRRTHVEDDARRLWRRRLHRAEQGRSSGGRSRRRRPRAGDHGARHRAAHGHCASGPPHGARGRSGGRGRVRQALVHASARVRGVDRAGEADRDAHPAGRGHGRGRPRGEASLMPLRGALAASITPLREHGSAVDDEAFGPLCDLFVDAGLDGILALGTAGEGILLRVEERRHIADLFLQASDKRLQVAVHCGAQTTADTVLLSAHAAEVGAAAVVVIGPPYFKLDENAQYAHFFAAAAACAPLPFYVYEFAATTGYPVAPAVLERLRDAADNVIGLKVSDTPFAAFEKYLLPGFDIFVGPEALIAEGLARGAIGAVSALASALPREVGAVVRAPSTEGAGRLGELRAFVEQFPRQAALKRLLALQGVPVREEVRAPLRSLTAGEREQFDAWAEGVLDYAASNSS